MQGEATLERRIVTVLFADLVGFTTLSEQYDPEDVAAIQDRYFAAVRETIGRYGGRLEKFIGDAAMAVFGVPRSRDDDAQRAVRAGLALIHAVQQIGPGLGLDEDVLRLRVGINTGEAVIAGGGADEGRVTGDTVNTAARFQTAAPPGRVMIGETTALAVADVAELEDPVPLELKGKADLTPGRLVIGFRAEASREQAMGALRAPTLGRDRELAELDEALTRAADGATERWLVVAPPGVGKSRLLREVAERAGKGREGTVIWRTRTRPDAVSPFDSIAGLLLEALEGETDRSTAEATLLDRLASADVPEARARVVTDACLTLAWPPASAGNIESRPTEERDTLFAAWLEGLNALAGGATQVWLVEDVHWAGGDVLAFLDLATGPLLDDRPPGDRPRDLRKAGSLIIATCRPSLLDANPAWAADDPAGGRHLLHLATLEPTDARGLITALVGKALPPELVERIAERSDGNCLFIEELLRTWVSVGTVVRDTAGAAWRLAVPADEIPLPQSVQSIYAAQLDDLPPDARRLARRASVAGRRFPVRALEPLEATDAGLEPLRRRELIMGPISEPVFGDAFSYRHALLRDAGYASLARAERARLHARLARWLEQAAGDHATEVAEQIAGHYAAALDSAPALAREIDDGLDREAVRHLASQWYERAGQGTLSLSAHDAARQLFRRAIDLTPDQERLEQARRWERLGDATAFAADMDEGAAAYQKAMELYRAALAQASAGFDRGTQLMDLASDDMTRRSEQLRRGLEQMGETLGVPGLGDAASALAQGADELRQGSAQLGQGKAEFEHGLVAARSGLARATASLADVWYQQLRFADARDLASNTLKELGDADPVSTARLLVARGEGSLGASGPSPEVTGDLERALELARAASDEQVELSALRSLTTVKHESGLGQPEDWREIGELAARMGSWESAISAKVNGAMMLLDDHAGSVFAPAAEARELAAAHGMVEHAGWADYLEAEAAFISGDWDRAVAAGTRAMDLGEQNAYRRLTVRIVHVMVPIAAVRGDRAMLERAAAFYASIEGKFQFPDSPYARVVRAAQDLELATTGLAPYDLPEVEPRIVAFEDEPAGGSWSAALDRVFRAWIEAANLDGAARAVAAMEAALPRYQGLSSLGRGTFELLRGRLALARGARDDASIAARAALEQFRRSQAPWWIAKAIRLLERAGSADYQTVSEVFEIERRLGATEPIR